MSLLTLLRYRMCRKRGVILHLSPSSWEQQKLHILVCSPTPKFNKEAALYLPIEHVASSPVYNILQPYSLNVVHLMS